MNYTQPALVWIAKCCREWPVLPFVPIGRCGYCNEIPEVVQ